MSYCYEYSVDGPYECGYREFTLSNYTFATIGVYYPIDKEQYANSPRTVRRLREGLKTLKGLRNAIPEVPEFLLRYSILTNLDVVENADLHTDFTTGSKELVPVIFSHGLTANRTISSYSARELVSFGCIVYALDHTDSSGSYFLNRKIDPPQDVFCTKYNAELHKVSHEKYRQNQLKIRVEDINGLLEYIKTQEIKDIPAINLAKLVMAGHSMGGMTSLEACYHFQDLKYCISIDPFFVARWQQIEKNDEFAIKQPLCIINSQYFHKVHPLVQAFDSFKTLEKFYGDCLHLQKNKNISYNLIMPNTDHYNQTDPCLSEGMSLKLMGMVPITSDAYAKLKEMNLLMVAFLNECELLPISCNLKVKEFKETEII